MKRYDKYYLLVSIQDMADFSSNSYAHIKKLLTKNRNIFEGRLDLSIPKE